MLNQKEVTPLEFKEIMLHACLNRLPSCSFSNSSCIADEYLEYALGARQIYTLQQQSYLGRGIWGAAKSHLLRHQGLDGASRRLVETFARRSGTLIKLSPDRHPNSTNDFGSVRGWPPSIENALIDELGWTRRQSFGCC